MKIKEAYLIRLHNLCEEKNYNPTLLAREATIPPSTVHSIFDPEKSNPTLRSIKILCEGLKVDIQTFFADDIFKDLEPEIDLS